MEALKKLTKAQLQDLQNKLKQEYDEFKARKLSLDMSRGKPCTQQLDLSMPMLDMINAKTDMKADGVDVRNYGVLEGLSQTRQLFADVVGVPAAQVIAGGNSSLNMMYDAVVRAMQYGVDENSAPWGNKIKFLCPSPGYDRHFSVCESLGIEMIAVNMNEDGPDMDEIETLAAKDESIKGIWCVPMYSNPLGITFSNEVVTRFAALKPKALDFRIFWDNAYCVHHFCDEHDTLLNIFDAAKQYGSQDMIYEFASTSKITFAGAGVAAFISSEKNITYAKKIISMQTICPDKINQLRHNLFLPNVNELEKHMKKHKEIVAPHFEAVIKKLDKEIKPLEIASYTNPKGGYFISLDTLDGCAARVVLLCREAGVVITPAGASFPYGKDPKDKNIRIAPTFPPISELEAAMDLFVLCLKIASVEKMIAN